MSSLGFINEFPVLRHRLDLGDYHIDLVGNTVEVWLNLSDDFQERWRAFNADVQTLAEESPEANLTATIIETRNALFAELWNLDVGDVAALFEQVEAAGLRAWMMRRTWEIIEEYASGRGEAGGS